jgi:hypothetical protein
VSSWYEGVVVCGLNTACCLKVQWREENVGEWRT